MPDEIDMLEDAAFENEMTEMGEDQPRLLRFIATQQHKTSKVLVNHGKRIKRLENTNKKVIGGIGGVGALIATGIMAALDYILKRGA